MKMSWTVAPGVEPDDGGPGRRELELGEVVVGNYPQTFLEVEFTGTPAEPRIVIRGSGRLSIAPIAANAVDVRLA